jgi:glycosyltransferase involved in cell wall biosynthesis
VSEGPLPAAPLPAARARILHVHKVAGLGGSERHLEILLPRLDRRRFDVSLFLLTEPRRPVADFIARFRTMGICVDQAVIRRDLDPGCLLALYRRLRREPVDLVHTHLIHADLYGALASRLAGVRRVISTRHNDDAFRRRADVRAVTRLVGQRWSRVIALSRYLAEFVRRVEGVDPRLIRTVPYGMELPDSASDGHEVREELGLSCEAPLVVSVGRLVKQKGHAHLLRAWPVIARARPRARLLVVGEGPWRARLVAEASALGVADRVIFAGWRFDVPAILAAADLYVQPSLWEGFGLAILEAMAAGTCIVASRVSTIPELVLEEKTGLLVPPGDSAALAEAILRLLADPERRREMGEAGRRRAIETFSAEHMVRATETVYEDVLGSTGPGGGSLRGQR